MREDAYWLSLALRENVLLTNGSRIAAWWIMHHYMSAVGCLVFLTWPQGPAYHRFERPYLYFCLVQGVAQLFQNRYQKQRHYVNHALGRVSEMDVDKGETLRVDDSQSSSPSLVPVLVVVFAAQLLQLYYSFKLFGMLYSMPELKLWQSPAGYREEVQVLTSAILALVLGVGNFVSTLRVVIRKRMMQGPTPEKKAQ